MKSKFVALPLLVTVLLVSCESTRNEGMTPEESRAFFENIAAAQRASTETTSETDNSSEGNTGSVTELYDIPLVTYNVPGETSTSSSSPSTTITRGGSVDTNRAQFTIIPRSEDYKGGAVVYNFIPNNIYSLFVAPLKVLDLQMEPGEHIVSPPVAGDTSNFQLVISFSYEDGIKREHVFIKPVYAGRETNLTINTDRRTYQFLIKSFETTYMPIVTFAYPLSAFSTPQAEAQKAQEEALYLSGRITDLDFSYEIIPSSVHRPAWMPATVFNDGRKTYINFASARRASYAPVLFGVENGQRVILNYRVIGSYYIVDTVINRAELIVDVNAGNIITIQRVPN